MTTPQLFKNITRTKPFQGADLEIVHNEANDFIENTLEVDPDKTYAVKVAAAYSSIAGIHVVVIEYSYLQDVAT